MFNKYDSITNSYDGKFINLITSNISVNERWIVTEKLHGANLGIEVRDGEVYFQSRNMTLEDTSNFYSLDSIKEELTISAKAVGKDCTIYGELVGGTYVHEGKEVKPADFARVQKGIMYHNENKFVAFDIRNADGSFMEVYEARPLLQNAGFKILQILKTGSLDTCLAYPNEFNSHVFSDMPVLDDNVCEGVVIRPLTTYYVSQSRVILKNKNEKWTEKASAKKRAPKPADSEELNKAKEDVSCLINENRMNAVISKLGAFNDIKTLGTYMKEFVNDVFEDFPEASDLAKTDKKDLGKFVMLECKALLIEELRNV